MARRWPLIFCLLLAPLTQAQEVADPRGDAHEYSTELGRQAAAEVCWGVPSAAHMVCDALGDEATGTGVVPAAPALDIVGASVVDTGTTVDFRLDLASVSQWSDFVNEAGLGARVEIRYEVGACSGAVLTSIRQIDGRLFPNHMAYRWTDTCAPAVIDPLLGRCSTVNECTIPLAAELQPGAPGAIIWRVPRSELHIDVSEPVRFHAVTMRAGHSGTGGWLQLGEALESQQVSVDGRASDYRVDDTAVGTFVMRDDGVASWAKESSRRVVESIGNSPPSRTRIVAMSFADTPTHLHITFDLALVDAADLPDGILQFQSPARHHYAAYVRSDGSEWEANAIRWLPGRAIPIPVDVTFNAGTPGSVTFSFPRAAILESQAGQRFEGAGAGFYDIVHDREEQGATGYSYAQIARNSGNYGLAAPYRLATSTSTGATHERLSMLDRHHDVILPAEAPLSPSVRAAQFDITHVDVFAVDGATIQVNIGLMDLDELTTPTLFDAVLYGVGIHTSSGEFMAAVRSGRTQSPEAFCGPDVAFLTPDPRDPGAGAGIPVAWNLRSGNGVEVSIIELTIPIACLATGPVPEIHFQRVVARSALISARQFAITDEATGLQGESLVFPRDAEPTLAVQKDPFGIANFWDILGATIAVLTIVASVGLVMFRRRRLKSYLRRLDALRKTYEHDPATLQRELGALHTELREALESGLLPTDHFGIVDQSLDRAYVRARLGAFGMNFGDIPHAAVVTIERLVRDGEYSNNDLEITRRTMQSTGISAARQQEVLQVLREWVRDDEKRTAPRT